MSGIAKAVKKVWRPIEKLGSKMTNIATFGLHDKWKKTRHKIIKSKAFKIVVAAVAIYFGGAALLSMAGGGTASAGLGSAWAGAQGAGSALAAGNFSGAASALGSGFTGGAAAGAGASFGAGQAATANVIAGNTAAGTTVAGAGAGTAAGTTSGTSAATTGDVVASLGTNASTNVAGEAALKEAATQTLVNGASQSAAQSAAQEGLLSSAWNSLGEAGKAAVISGGMQVAGSAMQGQAEQDAIDDERKRRTYWGIDGEGNTAGQVNFGLMNPVNFTAGQTRTPTVSSWQTSLDDLINRQKQVVGG